MENDPQKRYPGSGAFVPERQADGAGTRNPGQGFPGGPADYRKSFPGPQEEERTGDAVPEWQRNTWIAPFPTHEYPFDEPEDAPELRDMRSEELNNRSGDFWQTQTSGYRFGQEAPAARKQENPKKADGAASVPKRWKILGAALILAGLFLALYYGLFTVRSVTVTGNEKITTDEILELSGLRTGMPMFSLNSAEIEGRIERNPLLKFRYMEKELPSRVILCVQEREECCWMTWNGIIYTMDKQRFIMSESENLEDLPDGLVRVNGLRIRSGAQTGQRLVLDSLEQQEVFSALFLEMKVLGCTGLIREADLSSLGSILLTTQDGFTVSLGDSRNIHAKLRSMMLTRDKLLGMNYHSGVINVTLPETPVFSPDSI